MTSEENAIVEHELKLGFSELPVSLVCTTIKKYSFGDVISDTQIIRILQRLLPSLPDVGDYKHRFFGESFFHTNPTGFDRVKLATLGLLLSHGTNTEKANEFFLMLDSECAGILYADVVERGVRNIVSVCVIYCPLLVKKNASPMLATYQNLLERKADQVIATVVGYILNGNQTIRKESLISKFNSPSLSKFLTPAGVRKTIVDFKSEPVEDGKDISDHKKPVGIIRRGQKVAALLDNFP